LTSAVFGPRESHDMARKIYRTQRPGGSPRAGPGVSGAKGLDDLPEATGVEQTAKHQALLDEGLRLNRAFIQIKDPLIRKAIVDLVADAAGTQSCDAVFLAAERAVARFRAMRKER
jgi:hypothetical protein